MSGRSRLRSAGLLVAGVALGVGIAVGGTALTGDDGPATAGSRSADIDPKTLLDPARLAEVEGERVRAQTAREAVEAFLGAEQAGDSDASFALLADRIRLDYGSTAAWSADPDAVPQVVGFEVEQAAADEGGERSVTTLTRYRSSLDAVAGLVPARARTAWAVVQEEGGWAVDLEATTQVPLLPPDADAVSATRDWVDSARACEEGERSLRGSSRLAGALCGAAGPVETAASAVPLDSLSAGSLQNSLGGEVGSWARQVDVQSPVALRAVLAPIDDRWVVVAVLDPPGTGR